MCDFLSLQSPQAIFIGKEQNYSDSLMCSGIIPAELNSKPCPYSNGGQFPGIVSLDDQATNYSIDKGKQGDLCLICALSQLSNLDHWQGHQGQQFPSELLEFRLFKCRMGFWLVIPRLYDQSANRLS